MDERPLAERPPARRATTPIDEPDEDDSKASPAGPRGQSSAKSGFGCGIGCLAALGVAVVVGIIAAITSTGVADRAPVYDEISAYTYCEIAVREELKSPSTAAFSQMSATGSGGSWTARGVVDSENSFGAIVRASFQCTIKDGEQIRVDYITN